MNTDRKIRALLRGLLYLSLIVLSGCSTIQYNEAKVYAEEGARYFQEGLEHYKAKRYSEAEAAFTSAINAYKAGKERCDEAQGLLVQCETYSSYYQTMKELYTTRARARMSMGDMRGGVEDLEHAVQAYPEAHYPAAWYFLVVGALKIGDQNRAEEAFEHLKKEDPELAAELMKKLKQQ